MRNREGNLEPSFAGTTRPFKLAAPSAMTTSMPDSFSPAFTAMPLREASTCFFAAPAAGCVMARTYQPSLRLARWRLEPAPRREGSTTTLSAPSSPILLIVGRTVGPTYAAYVESERDRSLTICSDGDALFQSRRIDPLPASICAQLEESNE